MIDGGAMFGVVPKTLWMNKYPANEKNLCNCAIRSLLIDTGEQVILIDTGIGTKLEEKASKFYYLNGDDTLEKSLQKNGYSTNDITDVILTHLHFDHCGGATKYSDDGKYIETTFKNAKYWCNKTQWEWAINPNRREKPAYMVENLVPLKESGQLNFIENDIELYPNIFIKIFYGHTQGLILPYIQYNDKVIFYAGDLLPAAANIPISYIASYDILPLTTINEKIEVLEEAAENNHILFFQHDLYNECCTVKKSPKGIIVDDKFTFASITKK